MHLDRLRENLETVRGRIADACRRSGRDPAGVRLVAVTKRNPAEWIAPLVELGQHDLGENYPQELWRKVEELAGHPVRWHLIGHLQGNKARRTYPLVRMIHSVDSLKLLRALDDLAANQLDPAPVLLQVNCSDEPAKHGWEPETLLADSATIAECRSIQVAGLMTIAPLGTEGDSARPSFVRLREVRDRLRDLSGLPLSELSIGMSSDYEVAVEEGSTLIRVGSALFEGVAP